MAKNTVKNISDKLEQVNDSFTVNMYDNGFMVEISGKASDDEWATAKIMCATQEELVALIIEATSMKRSN